MDSKLGKYKFLVKKKKSQLKQMCIRKTNAAETGIIKFNLFFIVWVQLLFSVRI